MTNITEFFKALSERLQGDGFAKSESTGSLRWVYEAPALTDYIGHRGALLQVSICPWNPERTKYCVKVLGRLVGFGSDIDIYTEAHDLDIDEAMCRIQGYRRTLQQRADCFVESYKPETQELVNLADQIVALKALREQKKQQLYQRTRIQADEILKGLVHAE